MRVIHGVFWGSVLVLQVSGCGPRVSVGELGGDGGAESDAGAGGSGRAGMGKGGDNVTGGGGTTSSSGAPSSQGGGAGASESGEAGGPGNVAGAASDGGAGPLPADCATTLSEFLPSPVPDCPEQAPTGDGEPCDIVENAICTWQTGVQFETSPGFYAFGCYPAESGKAWFGIGVGTLGEVGSDPQNCPKVQPADGSSCAGHAGEHCYYMPGSCSCAAENAEWSCEPGAKAYDLPRPVQRLCPPQGLDESKQLKDLTDGERELWCNWYGDPSGEPRPPVTDNDPPDEARSYASHFIAVGAPACMMELPVEHCVTNLRLRADCSATLAELDDCVETIRAVGIGTPGPGWVGRGCGPLLANPTCQNVIAQVWEDPSSSPSGCFTPLN